MSSDKSLDQPSDRSSDGSPHQSLDLARIRALCFDVDGTLSDTDEQFVINLIAWLKPGNFLFPQRNPRRFARWVIMRSEAPGNLILGLPDRLGIDHHLARWADAIYRLGIGRQANGFILIDGIRETLACLQAHYPLAIVSARGQRSTQAFLDQYNLNQFFTCVATAQTCRYTKPYPDPILWAAAQMGVLPENCLMIGDTTVDIRAGKAAGAQTVAVLCGFGEEAELRRIGPDLILKRTPDLVEALLVQLDGNNSPVNG